MGNRFRGMHRRSWVAVAALLLICSTSVYAQTASPATSESAPPAAATTAPAPSPAAPAPVATLPPRIGAPARIRIPKIHVDAAVERVGTTDEGAMDTPKNFNNAAWYQPGPRPGEPGNAVIDGHVDSAVSGIAVFWSLRQLVAGDEIRVLGDDGVERRFLVTGWETYAYTDVPLGRIFGPASGAHLNLITCDQNSHFDYTKREYGGSLVVYADSAP